MFTFFIASPSLIGELIKLQIRYLLLHPSLSNFATDEYKYYSYNYMRINLFIRQKKCICDLKKRIIIISSLNITSIES